MNDDDVSIDNPFICATHTDAHGNIYLVFSETRNVASWVTGSTLSIGCRVRKDRRRFALAHNKQTYLSPPQAPLDGPE